MAVGISTEKKQLAVLIDPDVHRRPHFELLLDLLGRGYTDVILVGGSTSSEDNIDELIKQIKSVCELPIILFPGNKYQLSEKADALLMLSLISGRNPDYLIGRQVEAAPLIRSMGLTTIPTGYMMIGQGKISSTSYMTQTLPIPSDKADIAVHTALAGEMLGMKALYLEGGSGMDKAIPAELIKQVSQAVEIPIIVGGGISYPEQALEAYVAGADMVVIGTALERNPELLVDFYRMVQKQKIEV